MAPTRMKLRVRRRDTTAAAAGGGGEPAEERSRGGRSSRRRKNNVSTTTVTTTSSLPSTSSSAAASARAAVAVADEASPDSKCPICLDRFNNLAYLDRCLHRFCFPCIQEWSHNKAECPLCKQPFASILHSVRAEDDFKEYTLQPAPASDSVAAMVAAAVQRDPQIRLMVRRRRLAAEEAAAAQRATRSHHQGETPARRWRRERRGGGGGAGGGSVAPGVWEWYLDTPPPPGSPPPQHHQLTSSPDHGEGDELEQQRIRTEAGLEGGVVFHGLTGLGGMSVQSSHERVVHRLRRCLRVRRRSQVAGTLRPLGDRDTLSLRRALYHCGVRVHGIAGLDGPQEAPVDDGADASFHRDRHRLVPWARRELTVLYGAAQPRLVDIVLSIIIIQVTRHGVEDVTSLREALRPFLLARTEHFLHELVSFARSPLAMELYDLLAVYEPPAAATAPEPDRTGSPSDSSSVIAISGGEEDAAVGGRTSVDDVIQTGSCLSLSEWDDETAGPSYSTADALLSLSHAPREPANEDDGAKLEEEECLIVGYKKPIAERTPELVQLSSDSEEDDGKAKGERPTENTTPLPSITTTTTPPPSVLPTIPPSTSGGYREEQCDVGTKPDEAAMVRSWSASSDQSRVSVCSLSPSERCGEQRRRKRKRRAERETSGTLYNPNRSIYPAMMSSCRRHSPSPFHSSVDTPSPPPAPHSPLDLTWAFSCSSLTSFTSSASHSLSSSSPTSSSSPLCLSPPPSSPPTPPRDTRRSEKPGGKRKYKSRHLDSNDSKDPTWRPSGGVQKEGGGRRSQRGRERGERRRGSGRSRGERKCREERSPSVEIVYERSAIVSDAPPLSGRKRRRKQQQKTQHNSSPVIITLDSDSSHDDVRNISSVSGSPPSSQQTIDFSDLPPLPLAPSAGVGGALGDDIAGELPIDILDRGSDNSLPGLPSRSGTAGPVAVESGDNSDRDIDVENDDNDNEGASSSARRSIRTLSNRSRTDDSSSTAANLNRSDGHTSDTHLLATILESLKGLDAPKSNLSQNLDTDCSPDSRKNNLLNVCEKLEGRSVEPRSNLPKDSNYDGTKDENQETSLKCAPSLPRERAHKDVPQLLQRVCPFPSHKQNTATGTLQSPAADQVPPHPYDLDPVDERLSHKHVSPSHTDHGLPRDKKAIPPISTLKKHFASSLGLQRPFASGADLSRLSTTADSRSSGPSDVNASTTDVQKPPVDAKDSPATTDSSLLSSFHSSLMRSGFDGPPSAHLKTSPSHLHHANSVPQPSWSERKPAGTVSTSVSHGKSTVSPNRRRGALSDFRLCDAEAAGRVLSGVGPKDTSPPCLLSPSDTRTQNTSSPTNSHSSNRGQNPPQRTDPRPVGSSTRSPSCTLDFHSSVPPSEGLGDSNSKLVVNHENSSLNPGFITTLPEGHLNHKALPSETEHQQHLDPKPNLSTDSKSSRDHITPSSPRCSELADAHLSF